MATSKEPFTWLRRKPQIETCLLCKNIVPKPQGYDNDDGHLLNTVLKRVLGGSSLKGKVVFCGICNLTLEHLRQNYEHLDYYTRVVKGAETAIRQQVRPEDIIDPVDLTVQETESGDSLPSVDLISKPHEEDNNSPESSSLDVSVQEYKEDTANLSSDVSTVSDTPNKETISVSPAMDVNSQINDHVDVEVPTTEKATEVSCLDDNTVEFVATTTLPADVATQSTNPDKDVTTFHLCLGDEYQQGNSSDAASPSKKNTFPEVLDVEILPQRNTFSPKAIVKVNSLLAKIPAKSKSKFFLTKIATQPGFKYFGRSTLKGSSSPEVIDLESLPELPNATNTVFQSNNNTNEDKSLSPKIKTATETDNAAPRSESSVTDFTSQPGVKNAGNSSQTILEGSLAPLNSSANSLKNEKSAENKSLSSKIKVNPTSTEHNAKNKPRSSVPAVVSQPGVKNAGDSSEIILEGSLVPLNVVISDSLKNDKTVENKSLSSKIKVDPTSMEDNAKNKSGSSVTVVNSQPGVKNINDSEFKKNDKSEEKESLLPKTDISLSPEKYDARNETRSLISTVPSQQDLNNVGDATLLDVSIPEIIDLENTAQPPNITISESQRNEKTEEEGWFLTETEVTPPLESDNVQNATRSSLTNIVSKPSVKNVDSKNESNPIVILKDSSEPEPFIVISKSQKNNKTEEKESLSRKNDVNSPPEKNITQNQPESPIIDAISHPIEKNAAESSNNISQSEKIAGNLPLPYISQSPPNGQTVETESNTHLPNVITQSDENIEIEPHSSLIKTPKPDKTVAKDPTSEVKRNSKVPQPALVTCQSESNNDTYEAASSSALANVNLQSITILQESSLDDVLLQPESQNKEIGPSITFATDLQQGKETQKISSVPSEGSIRQDDEKPCTSKSVLQSNNNTQSRSGKSKTELKSILKVKLKIEPCDEGGHESKPCSEGSQGSTPCGEENQKSKPCGEGSQKSKPCGEGSQERKITIRFGRALTFMGYNEKGEKTIKSSKIIFTEEDRIGGRSPKLKLPKWNKNEDNIEAPVESVNSQLASSSNNQTNGEAPVQIEEATAVATPQEQSIVIETPRRRGRKKGSTKANQKEVKVRETATSKPKIALMQYANRKKRISPSDNVNEISPEAGTSTNATATGTNTIEVDTNGQDETGEPPEMQVELVTRPKRKCTNATTTSTNTVEVNTNDQVETGELPTSKSPKTERERRTINDTVSATITEVSLGDEVEESEPPVQPPKRKRGRKRKTVNDTVSATIMQVSMDDQVEASEPPMTQPPKRKRGRKRKCTNSETTSTNIIVTDTPTNNPETYKPPVTQPPKRKRGRKRKCTNSIITSTSMVVTGTTNNNPENVVPPVTQPKKRGRKRKCRNVSSTIIEAISNDPVESIEPPLILPPMAKRTRKCTKISTTVVEVDLTDPVEAGSSNTVKAGSNNSVEAGSINKVEAGSSNTVKSGSSDPVKAGSNYPVKVGSNDTDEAGSSNTFKLGSTDPVKASSSNTFKLGSTDPVKASSSNMFKSGSTDPVKASSSNTFKSGSIDPVKASSSNTFKSGSTNPVKASSSNTFKSGSIDPVKASSSNTFKSGTTDPVKASSSNMFKSGSTDPVKAGSTNKVKTGSSNTFKAGSTDPVKAGSSNKVKAGSNDPVEAGDHPVTQPPRTEERRAGSSNASDVARIPQQRRPRACNKTARVNNTTEATTSIVTRVEATLTENTTNGTTSTVRRRKNKKMDPASMKRMSAEKVSQSITEIYKQITKSTRLKNQQEIPNAAPADGNFIVNKPPSGEFKTYVGKSKIRLEIPDDLAELLEVNETEKSNSNSEIAPEASNISQPEETPLTPHSSGGPGSDGDLGNSSNDNLDNISNESVAFQPAMSFFTTF